MSAAVCGGKRSFFDDLAVSPPATKRHRCSSSPNRPPPSTPPLLDHLRDLFPDFDNQIHESVAECENDIDTATMNLNRNSLGSVDQNLNPVQLSEASKEEGDVAAASENISASSNLLPVNGADWVELLVREMTSATSMDDARSRATRVLGSLENSITTTAVAEASQSFQKEKMAVKEQLEALIRDNNILKRAVAIQHERQKEYDDKNQELQLLKQLLSQYQEKLRELEVNNYALKMYLKQAEQRSSIPGRFHPDIF